jgi:nucleotide-binding universal stress UspA family protein
MTMQKILVPIAFPMTAHGVANEAATLARRFKSEIILLHVVTPPGHVPGMPMHGPALTEQDRHVDAIKRAQESLDEALLPQFNGLTVRRLLLKGDPASEIVRTAREEKVDLIAMSTHSHGVLYRLLLGSTAAKVLHHAQCPVWTDTRGNAPEGEFAIRGVLCAVDLGPHSRNTVSHAAQLAADFGARLTLVHVTPAAEAYGPGGYHVVAEWQEALVGYASEGMTRLQQELHTSAEVIIENGKVSERLNFAAEQTKSDLLVLGRKPPGGHLGDNGGGYAIIRDARIAVLSF